jgi:hypothetical protein
MANVFVALPVVANAVGAAVDTSSMGKRKTITLQGNFTGTIIIEISCDGGTTWAQRHLFFGTGKKVLDVAADRMRTRSAGVTLPALFAPSVDVGANTDGGNYGTITAPAKNATGAALDISTFGNFTTFVVQGNFSGVIAIQISEDGTDYAECATFANPGVVCCKELVGNFVRAQSRGANISALIAHAPVVTIGAINDGGAAAGGGAPNCLTYQPGGGLSGPVIFDTWADLMTQLDTLRAAANGGGCYDILIDDSVTSPAVIPASGGLPGAYDMTNVRMKGAPATGALRAEVQLADTVIFTNLRHVVNLTIDHAGIGSTIEDLVASEEFIMENTSISVSGTAAFFSTDTTPFIIMLRESAFTDDNFEVLESTAGGSPRIRMGQGTTIEDDTLRGAGAVSPTAMVDSADIGATQTNLAGSLNFVGIDEARMAVSLVFTSGPVGAVANQIVRCNPTGGGFTINLPKADVNNGGKRVIVKEVQGSANTLTIAGSGGDAIQGSTTIAAAFGARMYMSNGSNAWMEVADPSIASERYSPPEKWFDDNVAAGQVQVALGTRVSTLFTDIKMIRAGSIVGLSTRLNAAVTNDTYTVTVTVNGAGGTLAITEGIGGNGNEATQAAGIDTFNAGDFVGMIIDTGEAFAPTTTDLEAWLDLEFSA